MKLASLLPKLLLGYLLAHGCSALQAMDLAPATETSTALATTSSVPPLTTLALQALLAPVTTLHENTFKESLRETLKKEHEAKIRAANHMILAAASGGMQTLTTLQGARPLLETGRQAAPLFANVPEALNFIRNNKTIIEQDIAKAINEQRNKLSLVDALPLFEKQVEQLPQELKDKIVAQLEQSAPFAPSETFSLPDHENVNSQIFSSDEKFLVTCSRNQIKIWNTATGTELFPIIGHTGTITWSPILSSNEQFLVTISHDQIKIWNIKTGTELFPITGHTGTTWIPVFSPDVNFLTTASDDQIKIWDINTGTELFPITGHTGEMRGAAFSSDEKLLATYSNDQVKIWDIKTRTELFPITGHTGKMYNPIFSPDGQLLVTYSADQIKIWDIKTGTELFPITGHTGKTAICPSFRPDGHFLVTCSDQIKIWNIQTGREHFPITGHTGEVKGWPSFNADGQFLVTRSKNQTKIWDIATGTELFHIPALLGSPDSLFSPDGQLLITESCFTLTIWDIKAKKALFSIENAHSGPMFTLGFSPDGQLLATTYVTTTHFYDIKTGAKLYSIPNQWDLSFSPSGQFFTTHFTKEKVKIWNLKPSLPLKQGALFNALHNKFQITRKAEELCSKLAALFDSLPREHKNKLYNLVDHTRSPITELDGTSEQIATIGEEQNCCECSGNYAQIGKRVKLACGHKTCPNCLYNLLYTPGNEKTSVQCPKCIVRIESKLFSQEYLVEHINREKYEQQNPGKKL